MRTTMIMVVAVCTTILSAGAALAGPTPPTECEASKNKTAGAYYSCREKAEATAITKATDARLQQVHRQVRRQVGRAETTGAGACPDTVLTAPMNAFIAAQAAEAASVIAGAPIRLARGTSPPAKVTCTCSP